MAAPTLSLLQLAREAEHRFWPKVDRRGPDECWPWTACTDRHGYGTLQIGRYSDGTRSQALAHRISWCLANDRDIPGGMCVLHRCDRPRCVSPRHLFLGTPADNAADKVAKGRSTRGEAHPSAVLSSYAARIVCRMAVSGKWKQREIASGFRISQQMVSRIKSGRRWASATADIREGVSEERRGLVLSCFPGIGLLDAAFEKAGFCVVRGPDVLWGGDVKLFHPPAGRFEGIIGGPPCQAFSRLRHLVEHNG